MVTDLEEQYDKIYRYCYMKLQHRQTAEDITQETFLRFWEAYAYKDMGKKLAYLYTIARNLCIDHYRKRKELPLPDDIQENSGEDRILDNVVLRQAVAELSVEDQELIFLRYVNEIPVGTIGELLGISRFAVRRRLNTCLKQLRGKLE